MVVDREIITVRLCLSLEILIAFLSTTPFVSAISVLIKSLLMDAEAKGEIRFHAYYHKLNFLLQ